MRNRVDADGVDGLNSELGLVGLSGIEVSGDSRFDGMRARRARETSQQGELRWE